jgi:hypothetical protein
MGPIRAAGPEDYLLLGCDAVWSSMMFIKISGTADTLQILTTSTDFTPKINSTRGPLGIIRGNIYKEDAAKKLRVSNKLKIVTKFLYK